MSETTTPAVAVKKDYTCDLCGKGQMRPTGMALTSHPVQYPHVCNNCDNKDNFYVNYPYIDFE